MLATRGSGLPPPARLLLPRAIRETGLSGKPAGRWMKESWFATAEILVAVVIKQKPRGEPARSK
jgi:hypothetical protein